MAMSDDHSLESRTTLGRVLEVLSDAVVDVVVAPAGLDVAVGTVVIVDGVSEPAVGRHDIALAVGVDASSAATLDLVTRLGRAGAAALVLRGDEALPPAVEQQAADAGLAVLRASRIDWGQLYLLLRTATAAAEPAAAEATGVRSAPLGDLFALANAIAAAVGGATTIEDRQLQVLAHSNLPEQPVDRVRLDSIVGRKVPEDVQRETAELYRKVWRSDRPVHLRAHEPTESRARMAISVKAGAEVLGTIWVLEGAQPFTADDEHALVEASRLAALHLMRHAAAGDVERRRRGELARSVLEGRVPFDAVRRELADDEAAECTIVAFEMHDARRDDAEAQRSLDRLVDVVALHAEAARRSSAAVALGPRVYLVLVEPAGTPPGRRRRVVDEIVRRARHAVSPTTVAAIGSTTASAAAVDASRRDAEAVLRVCRRTGRGPVVSIDEVRSQVTILRLADVIAASPELRTHLVDELQRHDDEHRTDYVTTARAYVEAGGSVTVAAGALFVHPNTLRYRLKRMQESTGVDCDDADTRLLLELEFRTREAPRA